MANNRVRTARLVIAYLTASAGGTGATGTTPVETVVPEKEPVEIVTEATEENGGTDLENQIDNILDNLENEGTDIVVTVPATEMEEPAGTEAPAETPAASMDDATRSAIASVAKSRAIRGNNRASGTTNVSNVNGGQVTNAEETVVSPDLANTGTVSQAEIVEEMLKTYPSGTKWDANVTYKNNSGCAAYAFMMLDKVYGSTDNNYVTTRGGSDVKQYSVAQVENGTHWVFVLEVNNDGTVRVAEANVNGAVYIGGIYNIDTINCVVNR